MDFAPDDTQEAVVRLARDVLSGTDPPERLWKALAQAGLLGLAVPDTLGGAGLGVLETALVLVEAGRRAAPVPALALALGVLPAARWGSDAQRRTLLAGVAAGDALLTAAFREPGDPMPAVPQTVATSTVTANPKVTGVKIGVGYAERARHLLVPITVDGGTRIAIVDPMARGVTLTRTPSATGEPEYTVRLDGVQAELLAEGTAADLYRYVLAGACALGAGAVAGALALTAAHVRHREQFGRPLAAFQAVAQRVSDVYVAARTTELSTLAACWRLATEPGGATAEAGREAERGPAAHPADEDLAVAAYWLASEGPAALRACHHLHGGTGLDASYPLHRYSALVRDLVRLLGGAEYRLSEVEAACSST